MPNCSEENCNYTIPSQEDVGIILCKTCNKLVIPQSSGENNDTIQLPQNTN